MITLTRAGATCRCVVTAAVLELRRTVNVQPEPAELFFQVMAVVVLVGRQEGRLGVVRRDWRAAAGLVGHSVGLWLVLRLLLHSLQLLLPLPQQGLQQLRCGLHVVPGRAVLGAALLRRTFLVGRGRLSQFLVESRV